MTAETKRGLLDFIRGATRSKREPTATEVEGALWKVHEQAQQGTTRIVESTAQVLASAARQQTVIDGITELARNAMSRDPEIEEPLQRIAASLDRLRLIALNVGLEGARLGDPAGRALMNVADEVRSNGERGAEALDDVRAVLQDIQPAWQEVERHTEALRESHGSIVTHVGRQQATAQQVVRDVESLGNYARQISDTDPETALILAEVGEHARGLIQALGSLGGRARRELVRSALGPSLQPLLRVLLDAARTPKGNGSDS